MIMVSVPGRHKFKSICLILSLLLALAPLGLAQTAQTHSDSTGSDDKDKGVPATGKSTDNTTDKSKSAKPAPTPEELKQMIIEQAKMMESMKAQLKQQQDEIDALKTKATTTDAVVVGLAADSTTNAGTTPVGTANSGTAAAANSSTVQATTPNPEDAIKNVLGAFRFSGDFRVRFDAIERSSLRNPTTGAIIVGAAHNARARYRLRFNADAIINDDLSFHTQLATGPLNNGLTNDQDFAGVTDRAPININEAWVDYHPKAASWFHGQAGRVVEVFADNSRFLFDDDAKFNGFNEIATVKLADKPAGFTSIEFRAGQYIFTNPNTAEVSSDPTNAFRVIGLQQGEQIRDAMLFHQGVLFNQSFGDNWTQQFGGDIQAFRLPNEIQLSSNLANGAPILVFNALGIVLTAGTSGTGNATDSTTLKYFAPSFDVARLTYQLNRKAVDKAGRWPISINIQGARNVGADVTQKDAMLASFAVGQAVKRGDFRFLYIFSIKGANSMISQLTDDDLGTNSGVNIRTHAFRVDIPLMRNVIWQNLFFFQRELANNGNVPGFFVPLQGITPRQYRFQSQLQFNFDFNRYTNPASK